MELYNVKGLVNVKMALTRTKMNKKVAILLSLYYVQLGKINLI